MVYAYGLTWKLLRNKNPASNLNLIRVGRGYSGHGVISDTLHYWLKHPQKYLYLKSGRGSMEV